MKGLGGSQPVLFVTNPYKEGRVTNTSIQRLLKLKEHREKHSDLAWPIVLQVLAFYVTFAKDLRHLVFISPERHFAVPNLPSREKISNAFFFEAVEKSKSGF